MRFSHFFVDRPIFASVASIIIVILGAISYFGLPVSQYPEVAPPTVVVRAQYPGANAQTVAETVATPLEQEINGVEGMLYMSSYSTGDGAMSLTITFRLGTDLDQAQVLVQNRVAIATGSLPHRSSATVPGNPSARSESSARLAILTIPPWQAPGEVLGQEAGVKRASSNASSSLGRVPLAIHPATARPASGAIMRPVR